MKTFCKWNTAACLNRKCYSYHRRTRNQSRYEASQWEKLLHSNDISHWLAAYLDWSLWTSSMMQYQDKLLSCLGISSFVCDVSVFIDMQLLSCRDHFVYAPSHWEMALQCNPSLIGRAHTQNDPWSVNIMKGISPCLVSRGNRAVRLRWKALSIHSIIKADQFHMNSKQNGQKYIFKAALLAKIPNRIRNEMMLV